MQPLRPELASGLCMVGFVYALMSAAVWVLFKRLNSGGGWRSWFAGTAAASLGAVLLGLRGHAPDWASVHVANVLTFAAYALGALSLRIEVGLKPHRLRLAAAFVLAAAVFLAADLVNSVLRVQVGTLLHTLGAGLLAMTGLQAARAISLRSVRLIGGAYMVYALLLLLLVLGMVSETMPVRDVHEWPLIGLAALLLAGTAAGLYGTLGFIGMAIERLRAHDLQQATALAREAAQRQAAEDSAQQLRHWLEERDNLVRVLAHEVRQPLNNASAALQAARSALTPSEADRRARPTAIEHRVQRAQSVLSQVIGSVDNTLAATALLASPDRVAQHDADIDLLVQLSLGDLDTTQVHRVQVERLTQTRTATMDTGLMRLALRNLLSNALAYSVPDTPVVLRLSDSDDPLALVFDVIDSGPGVNPERAPKLFLRGERGHHELPGHGLGLYVVQRVAELHDSRVDVVNREGGGSIFRLWLMQGLG